MRKFIMFCASFFTMALLIFASPVRAQNVSWVSPTGNDTNQPCGETTPCATFAGAIHPGVVQINCLASGNYGPVTLTTSMIIDCGTGNIGNVAKAEIGNTSINLDSPSAPITVVLRHLSFNGGAIVTNAVGSATTFSSGTVVIEDCTIHGYTGAAINFQPQNGRGSLQVLNSEVFNNATGISVSPASGQIASVTLDHVTISGNSQSGLVLGGGVVAGTMSNSIVVSNTVDGVLANAVQVFFTVDQSIISTNLSSGIHTNSAGVVLNVGATTIGGNGTGVRASSGSLISFGNNQISANGLNGTFTATTPLQ
jgi:hypothetical protein